MWRWCSINNSGCDAGLRHCSYPCGNPECCRNILLKSLGFIKMLKLEPPIQTRLKNCTNVVGKLNWFKWHQNNSNLIENDFIQNLLNILKFNKLVTVYRFNLEFYTWYNSFLHYRNISYLDLYVYRSIPYNHDCFVFTVNFEILIIVMAVFAGILLITTGCCIYCCCCRSGGNKKK